MALILASTSPYRKSLLERLGVPFECIAPAVAETILPGEPPRGVAERLAQAKAQAVAVARPDAIVIGADQVATVDEAVLGKPGSAAAAVEQLLRLQGRRHHLITALCMRHGEKEWRHTDVSQLTMWPLTRAEIQRYVDADSPVDCAGGYKLESGGIALFEAIETADSTAIVGLPLLAVTRVLRLLGVELLLRA